MPHYSINILIGNYFEKLLYQYNETEKAVI